MATKYSHRFSSRRLRCPACDARRGFAPLIDNLNYGHCFSCGYKNFPGKGKESYSLPLYKPNRRDDDASAVSYTPIEKLRVNESLRYLGQIPDDPNRECTTEEERAAIMEYDAGLSREEAERLAGCNRRQPTIDELINLRKYHPFAATLVQLTRPSILVDWHIGLGSDGATLFWYQNTEGRFINAKRILCGRDGFHREKSSNPSFLYRSTDGFGQCLYGEHQLHPAFLNYIGKKYCRSSKVVLVESEKTVVVMSHHKPDIIWLGSGGASGLTKAKAKVLQGRQVGILYDLDKSGAKGAVAAEKVLYEVKAKPFIIDPRKLFPNQSDGYDITDAVYDEYMEKAGAQ